jgi:putative glutamine amidotransferase
VSTTHSRPLIAIPGRFSESASALRFRAVVVARALAELVVAAGGEPLVVVPGGDPAERLAFADAILLPGGGDLDPASYGQAVDNDAVYDVDREQDATDLEVARWALDSGVPLLAVCRGMQVVNVALGGTLHQHVEPPHRNRVGDVALEKESGLARLLGTDRLTASCFHHQTLDRLGVGLITVGRSGDGTIEAVEASAAQGFFAGVQWHPEDTYIDDPVQLALVAALVQAASR